MEERKEKKLIKGSIDNISIDKFKILSEQMKKCICKIDGIRKGTGFFCKINYENKIIPVLMTNYRVISPYFFEYKKNLVISTTENRILININNNNILYSSPIDEYDLIIIKLNESKNEMDNYLEIDKHIFSNKSEKAYADESIYILHYPNGEKPSISFGYGFKQMNDYKMQHLCNTENCSSGGPILSLSSNKIIGIHRRSIRRTNGGFINFGTFLKFPLNELNQNKIYKIISIIKNKDDKVKNNNFLVIKNNNSKNYINEKTSLIIKDKKYKYNVLFDFFTNTNEKLDYNKIKLLFNNIGDFIMNEEELFNSENNIQSFKLLEVIQKILLLNKLELEKFYKTKYILNILKFKENILKKIDEGEINCNSYIEIFLTFEKIKIFNEKLKILSFNNSEEIEKLMKIFRKNFPEFSKPLFLLDNLIKVLKTFYECLHKNNIDKLEKLRNKIFSGMLNQIEKSEVIEEMNKIMPPEKLKKKYQLIDSLFFMQLYKVYKFKFIHFMTEEEIFQLTETDFNQLKLFFIDGEWSIKIPFPILKECFKSLNYKKKEALGKELRTLKKIFEIKNFCCNKELTLKGHIEIYKLKNEIELTTNSCIYFIDEFNAEKTEFYEELNKIKEELKINISLDKIEDLEKSLEKLGINVLEPKEEERNFLDILQCLYENRVSVKLLSKLNDKDINNLQSNLDKISFVNGNIQDIINCSNFIHDFFKEKKMKRKGKVKINDKLLIEKFIKKVSETKNITQSFYNYSNIAKNVEKFFDKLK